jgi:CRP-like cAMP-binding protein
MASMLELAAHLPELDLQPGDQLCAEGGRSGSIWVLVEGRLSVMKSDVQVNVIDQPGAIIGEVAVLLGTGNSATVVAETPTRVRYARTATPSCTPIPRSPPSWPVAWRTGSTSSPPIWPI